MTMPNAQVRRATVDDLKRLSELWKEENLPAASLEKRFKEFQLIEDEEGSILGAIGLEIQGLEGHLHSEAFARPELADTLRDHFWERIQVQAQNHGLVRVWTQLDAPFWHHSGFAAPSEADAEKLPAAFRREDRPWTFIQLKEEPAGATSIDKEFQMFKEAEREQTERMLRQARVLKLVAGVVSVVVFLLVLVWAFFFFKLRSQTGP